MYSLVSFLDVELLSLNVLNWQEQKPSTFFNDVVFKNYLISVRRIIETQTREVRSRKSYSQLSNHHNQNQIEGDRTKFIGLHSSFQVPNENLKQDK
jgi:hypothetical protein